MGISEESDALAVVVSEETGIVSLVVGGEIVSNLDGPSLRQRLSQLLRPRPLRPKESEAKVASTATEARRS